MSPPDTGTPTAPVAEARHRRRRYVSWAGAVLGAFAFALVAWTTLGGRSPASSPMATLTVYNAESSCQALRTPECGLSLSRDPYGPYSAEATVAKVFHGDRLDVECSIGGANRVTDESGASGDRWYRVRLTASSGWLPGVRTRDAPRVPTCAAG